MKMKNEVVGTRDIKEANFLQLIKIVDSTKV